VGALMFKDAISKKYQIEAVLDESTIRKGIAILTKNKDFNGLKKSYEVLRQDLVKSLDLSQEKAASIINYAIHI
jgi:hypothetical protein